MNVIKHVPNGNDCHYKVNIYLYLQFFPYTVIILLIILLFMVILKNIDIFLIISV